MHKLSRRDVLCGTGVAALAAAAVPFGLAKADGPISADQVKAQVLALANQLLGDNRPPFTAGEWIERKRIARAVQALVTDQVTPWTEDELSLIEHIRQHRPGWGRRS